MEDFSRFTDENKVDNIAMNSNSRTQTVPPDRGQPRPTAPPGPLPLDINLEQFDGSPASSPRQGETPKQFQKKGSFWQQWSPLKGSGANNTSNNNMNADSPERNPNSPTESAEGGERVVQQGSNKEVTFKKAKKLTRAASNHYMKPLHDLTQANKFAVRLRNYFIVEIDVLSLYHPLFIFLSFPFLSCSELESCRIN